MYRKRYHGITPKRVVGFLVLDRLFPRAIMHCVDAANRSLHAISGSPEGTFWNLAEKRLGQLRSELAYSTVDEIIGMGLHEFLDSSADQTQRRRRRDLQHLHRHGYRRPRTRLSPQAFQSGFGGPGPRQWVVPAASCLPPREARRFSISTNSENAIDA